MRVFLRILLFVFAWFAGVIVSRTIWAFILGILHPSVH